MAHTMCLFDLLHLLKRGLETLQHLLGYKLDEAVERNKGNLATALRSLSRPTSVSEHLYAEDHQVLPEWRD